MRRLFAISLVLGLVLAACGGSGSGDEGSTTTLASTSSTQGEATTTTVEATTTTTEGSTAMGGPDCVVGTWVLDTEAFINQMSDIFASADMPDATVTPLSGDFTVEMAADGTMTATRNDWGFAVETTDGKVKISINGDETGTWSADDSTMTVKADTSDMVVTASVEADGQTINLPQSPVDVPQTFATDSDYTCSSDVMTVTNGGITSTLNRK